MRSFVVLILLFKATVNAETDECLTMPCQNGGICTDTPESFTCDCTGTGYIGDTCQTDIDECQSVPCDNGGVCTNMAGSFMCDCTGTGYEGVTCMTDIDECQSVPCDNGGVCTNMAGSFMCDCTGTGYEGVTCMTDIDECQSVPCDNGGVCTNMAGSFMCDCTGTGYEGVTCMTDIDECQSVPCDNGGVCTNMAGSFMCDCTGTGYEGVTCMTDVNECDSTPCQNGGVCSNTEGSFTCDCSAINFMGPTCDNACWHVGESQLFDGDISVTQNGITCQAWGVHVPHSHGRDNLNLYTYPDSSVAEAQNYCRDPDQTSAPWCYTMDPQVRWDYCAIPFCPREPACTCSIHGDPHITTFDGQKINYQGVCVFRYVELVKAGCSVSVRFRTTRRNANRNPAFVEEIEVEIGSSGDVIVIGQDKQITVNGVPITAVFPGSDYVIQQENDFIVVASTCGLTAMYNGKKTAKVIIDEEDGDNVTGICGNCNGVKDDLKKADGTDVSSENDKFKKIGNSYAIPPLENCILPATSD